MAAAAAARARGRCPTARRRRWAIAEVREQVLGAIEVASGAMIADPFRPTAELVELLGVRAARLRASPRRLRLRPRWAYRAA